MHVGMGTSAKQARINLRVRPDIKEDGLALAEMHRTDLTEMITALLVDEIEKEKRERPELWVDATKRVKHREQLSKPRKKGRSANAPR